jgi:hypothetical protein
MSTSAGLNTNLAMRVCMQSKKPAEVSRVLEENLVNHDI